MPDVFGGHGVPVPHRSARVALENGVDLRVSLAFGHRHLLYCSAVAVGTYLRCQVFVYCYYMNVCLGSRNLSQMRQEALGGSR